MVSDSGGTGFSTSLLFGVVVGWGAVGKAPCLWQNCLWFLLGHCQIAKEREVLQSFVKASSLGSQKYNLHYNETEIMKAGGRCVIQRACCQRQ